MVAHLPENLPALCKARSALASSHLSERSRSLQVRRSPICRQPGRTAIASRKLYDMYADLSKHTCHTIFGKRLPFDLVVCILATCVLVKSESAQTNATTPALTEPYTMREDFQGDEPPSGLRVEAIYLVAILSEADPDTTYRFMIDDLSLKAACEAHFSVTTPATETIDPW